jgi:uncharacterized protein (DUF305 family)
MIRRPLAFAALALSVLSAPVLAQDATVVLPDICTAGGSHQMGTMEGGHQMSMDQAHTDLMKGMDEMNTQMMQGMSAQDIDVAFLCGMIPHHQGAINMAKAELEHGDDPRAREMAQKVIAAQEQEIKDMLDWLGKQAE